MQSRRPTAVPALALVLPSPNLTRRTPSSALSTTSPRTPRNSGGHNYASWIFSSAKSANRKSTDSWNSSNYGDDQEWEWKPEQTLLLSRTLDALPAHLLTPFNGPVPPSNLLDKIARGVAQAKGPEEWPHSIRATRMKLMELARSRGKEAAQEAQRRKIIREEDEEDEDEEYFGFGEVLQPTNNNTPPRRPLHRQNNMDYMNIDKPENNNNFSRLSSRHQRTERQAPLAPSNTNRAHIIPPQSILAPASRTLNTSTPSSSTLSSNNSSVLSAFVPSSSKSLRRSVSSTLSETSQSSISPDDLPPKIVRRTESFCAPSLSTMSGGILGRKQSFKRAPSFGVIAGVYREAAEAGMTNNYPSSDEEEKVRTKNIKKVKRTKSATPNPNPAAMDTSRPTSPITPTILRSPLTQSKFGIKRAAPSSGSATPVTRTPATKPTRKPKMNLQRNPSIIGPELPQPMAPPADHPSCVSRQLGSLRDQPAPCTPPMTAASSSRKLRRMRATSFARDPARRISFGSLPAPAEENEEFDAGLTALGGGGLDTAFQLQ